ncbi:MAG TPA: POTRA domain-containing protein, partial [Tenuifilaceae bacterium]|nr:POTRA domain-containing protein [Tenuifilaceae bacterium]HPE19079.1 POTRA domain-containing protein [Tenuifilaceae bacterium]
MFRFHFIVLFATLNLLLFASLNPLYSGEVSDSTYIVSKITISGNRITKDRVILRELTFSVNDTLFSSQIHDVLAQNKEN